MYLMLIVGQLLLSKSERREPDSNLVSANGICYCLSGLNGKPCPVFNTSTVFIFTLITIWIKELFCQVSMRPVKFNTIKTCDYGIFCCFHMSCYRSLNIISGKRFGGTVILQST